MSEDWPDIQFHIIPGSVSSDGGLTLRHALGKEKSGFKTHTVLLSVIVIFRCE